MAFLVRKCVRCGVGPVQLNMLAEHVVEGNSLELAVACQSCRQLSVYSCDVLSHRPSQLGDSRVGDGGHTNVPHQAIRNDSQEPVVSESVPDRVSFLFKEAAVCRSIQRYEAAGAIYRKTIDVATKHLFSHDIRLADRKPADALRARIKALGDMKILDEDIVELADVAVLDGNDAAHDTDPYTAEEAEALEELTADLLDRLFVRPAKLAAVRAKQIAAGQRKA